MQVYPTQTIYTFEQDGIQLILTVSPLKYQQTHTVLSRLSINITKSIGNVK